MALDPLDEPAHRDLLVHLALAGDRAGAMALYQRLADRLRRELGIAVSPQTRALVDRLRAGQLAAVVAPAKTTVALPAAPDVGPRLPDVLAPRRFRTAFVGRATQLAWLHQLWEDVIAGERRLALLAGEPGIGKTRLLAEFAASVVELGAGVIYGRAEEDSLISYQPFVHAIRTARSTGESHRRTLDAVAGIVPDLAHGSRPPSPTTPEAASRLHMFEAACDVLDTAAAERRLLIALDDLHWADAPTLRLLAHLARRAQPAPVLLLGAYRQTELDSGAALAGLLADLRRDIAVEELTLGGLASEDVAALLAQSSRPQPVDRLAARVRAETAGNPFFIEELIRHMADTADGTLAAEPIGLPASIKQAISRRVTKLGSSTRALLTAGAVLGPEFDLELAAEVEGLPLDAALHALDDAVRSGLAVEVSGPPGRVAFAHALVRDALSGSLTAARRSRLHALAAAALEPRAERDPGRHLQALVHHAIEGAPMSTSPRAAELAQQAAARATAAHAHEESARLLQRALAVLRRTGADPARQVTVLCALGEALERSGSTSKR